MRSKSLSGSRRRFTPAERVGLLAEYHRSQVTQREFVEQHDLSLATLTKWLRWERQGGKAPRRKRLPFAEVPLGQVLGTSRWVAEVVRPDGWTVRLAPDAPAALVEQLLRPC
jgi:transposase-like protein